MVYIYPLLWVDSAGRLWPDSSSSTLSFLAFRTLRHPFCSLHMTQSWVFSHGRARWTRDSILIVHGSTAHLKASNHLPFHVYRSLDLSQHRSQNELSFETRSPFSFLLSFEVPQKVPQFSSRGTTPQMPQCATRDVYAALGGCFLLPASSHPLYPLVFDNNLF